MKKIKLLLIIVLSLFIVPNVYAAEDVKVESVDVLEKSESTEVVKPATFEGLVVNVDIKFLKLNDYIKYKVVITNTSNKDYKIKDNTDFDKSKYIHYTFSFDNNSNIVKANTKKEMTVVISYDFPVPESELAADGTYSEPNKMVIDLDRGSSIPILNNPKTNSTILVLLFILTVIICSISYIGIKKKNKVTTMLLLFGVIALLPISILAIDEIRITINSKVLIETEIDFCVYDEGLTDIISNKPMAFTQNLTNDYDLYTDNLKYSYKYRVRKGMTFTEFKNSKYYDQVGKEKPRDDYTFSFNNHGSSNLKLFFEHYAENVCYAKIILKDSTEEKPIDNPLSQKIYSCDEGVYKLTCMLDA